jgi:multidrug efflux pump subunit AcrA (membrane-fusion protein)
MKIFRILAAMLVLGALAAALAGCNSTPKETAVQNQTATVTRGDITLDITAGGNLELSTTEDLTFDLFYKKGTVDEVTVAVGDSVKKEQVLATIDNSEWQDQIKALADAQLTAQSLVTTKERALNTAERQVTTKEQTLAEAEHQVTVKTLALRQAQIDLDTAQYNLDNIKEVKEQQDNIDYYNGQLDFIDLKIMESLSPSADPRDIQFWTNEKKRVQTLLTKAQTELNAILTGKSLNITTGVAIEVAKKQLAIETAQMNLETATRAIADAETAVDNTQQDLGYAQTDVKNAQTDLEDAKQNAADAQDSLDKAKAASPEIIAPFDGFVTKVNVAGGGEVTSGTVVVQIADPNKFKSEIFVSEMDILNVKIGVDATVTADAIPDVSFPAKVTKISPTATITSSVVNYPVTVEIQSLKAITTTETTSMGIFSGNFTPPADFKLRDNFTPSANFTLPAGTQLPTRPGNLPNWRSSQSELPATSANATAASKEYTLKSGMTVTVNLTIPLSTNVLLIPSSAITTQGGTSYVEVMLATGATETRAIEIGATDYTNTEVISGLNEGENVVVSGTTTTKTTTNTNRPNSEIRFFEGGVAPGP